MICFKPMRSILTGDSRIRIGTLVADTTTSSPWLNMGTKSTCILSVGVVTAISCNSYPMEDKMIVAGKLLMDRRKKPFSFVKVPLLLPFTITETAGTGSLVMWFFTIPLRDDRWAHTSVEKNIPKTVIPIVLTCL